MYPVDGCCHWPLDDLIQLGAPVDLLSKKLVRFCIHVDNIPCDVVEWISTAQLWRSMLMASLLVLLMLVILFSVMAIDVLYVCFEDWWGVGKCVSAKA